MGKRRSSWLGEKRTHPGFLSDGEAAREQRREAEMVRNIVGAEHEESSSEGKKAANLARWSGQTRIGETARFIVDFNGEDRLVTVYGKDVPVDSGFKLTLTMSQAIGIRDLMMKGIDVMRGTKRARIGERKDIAMDYDGGLVMLYNKDAQADCPFKLAFDKDELLRVLSLLKKVHDFF